MTYFIMHSGRQIDLSSLTSKDIRLEDIAHHLTKICRFGGALNLDQHYSVAQHSLLLVRHARSRRYNINIQRALLLHDATEAYLGDIVTGLKSLLPDYNALETKVQELINKKYNISQSPYVKQIVKELDTRIVLDEALFFSPQHYPHFKKQLPDMEPLGIELTNEYDLKDIYRSFLRNCDYLGIRDE